MKLFIGLILGFSMMNANISSNATEDSYLSETTFPIVRDNFVIISGCSGGGKSTLLAELGKRGYEVVLEPGRQIVKEQTAINGDALPWTNLQKFLELALSRCLYQFNSRSKSQRAVFFDRGIVDAFQLELPQPDYFLHAANRFRYNRLVFLVPPWEEIYKADTERKHDFHSAVKEFDELLIKYKHFGYETIIVPKLAVKERADFILDRLGSGLRIPQTDD